MGFFGLIPANELKARYNTVSKQLILIASGEAVCYTTSITFQRQQFLGGLKFALNGWVGPITGGEQPYNHVQSFSIELPNREIFPSNTVVFVTANYPNGKVVDIDYFIGEPLPSDNSGTGSAIPTSNGSDATADGGLPDGFKPLIGVPTNPDGTAIGGDTSEQQIYKTFKVPFQITASYQALPPLGTITVEFDRNHLELTDASIIVPEQIAWTFNSLQTGSTQIIVTTRGGGGTEEITVKTYDLYIALPTFIGPPIPEQQKKPTPVDSPPVTQQPTAPIGSNDPLPVDNPNKPPHIPLSWLGFVNIGINLLKKAYPLGVQLLEVDATPIIPGEVTNPLELNHLKIVASVRVSRVTANATAIIKSTGWGEFGPIEVTPAPWLGDVVIEWPIKMDIVESFKLLQAAGFTRPVEAVTLRQPLYPDLHEPYYIYAFPTGLFIAVGVNDGKVEQFGSGNLGFKHGEPVSS